MSLTLRVVFGFGILAAVAFVGQQRATPAGLAMPGDDPAARVEFAIVEVTSDRPTGRRWEATFAGRSGTARFDIVMEVRAPRPGEEYAFTEGELRARPGSNATDLLTALALAHHTARRGKTAARAESVKFATAILGTEVSRGRGAEILAGEFTSEPKGPWILAKIFLEPSDAELFIALNPSAGVGLFVPKDDEYWPDLEPILASVL